jgi:hypothetical protein
MFQTVVHLLVRWSSRQHQSQRGNPASLSQKGEIPRPIVFRRLWMFWIVLLAGTLAIASSVVPSSPSLPLATGYGGPTTAPRFCAFPLPVAQHFRITNQAGHPYTASTVPTTAQLTTLPRPTAHGQVFYDPRTNILCAVNAVVLRQAWFQITAVVSSPPPTAIPTVVPATPTASSTSTPPSFSTSSNNLWSQGALDALNGIWSGFYHWAGQTIQYVEDWATETLGFMWVTPAALTYKNGIVQEGVNWMLSLMDGVIMLLLVVGGYQCIIRTILGEPRQEVLALLFRVLLSAMVANFGTLYVIPQLIELNNTLCAGSLQVFLHASAGDFTVPFLGGINWVLQPLSWSFFLLIDLVLALLLSLSMTVRFALFLVCYILAPVGILCIGTAWGRLWGRLFFFSLFIQFFQVLVVAVGSAFSTSFSTVGSEGSLSPTTLFVGIATLYLAFKLPQLLMQPVVGAIYGDAQQGASLLGTVLAILAA